MEKDCNTCVTHKQGTHPDEFCRGCLATNLSCWKPMSKSYDATFRTEGSMLDRRGEIRGPQVIGDLTPKSAFDTQVGGGHYKTMKIQPVEFAVANKLDFFQKDVIKYVTRRKGDKEKRLEDLNKAKHYIDMYMEAIKRGDIE